MQKIGLKAFLSEVNRPNAVFSIKYRKDDGNVGIKEGATKRVSPNELSERGKMNRSGVLKLWTPKNGNMFDITIDFVLAINGMRVVRNNMI